MIKRFLFLMLMLSSLSGCRADTSQEAAYEIYRIHYQSILNNSVFETQSNNFLIETNFQAVGDGQYRYDVFIDEPRIGMFDVELLAIVDDGLLVVSDAMMPSLGIFEQEEYNLIPFQVNSERGFYKGFNLNGIVNQSPIQLKVLVMWKDYFKIRSFSEYFAFELPHVEVIEEPEPEETESTDTE